jgi:hypothetical protein
MSSLIDQKEHTQMSNFKVKTMLIFLFGIIGTVHYEFSPSKNSTKHSASSFGILIVTHAQKSVMIGCVCVG